MKPRHIIQVNQLRFRPVDASNKKVTAIKFSVYDMTKPWC